ncbi:MAG: AAA family ATPase [bacterium]
MIVKLILEQFGKFRDKTFDFSPVTIFYGKNESGKTTIFDALFDALCKPIGTGTAGKELRKRYGDKDKRRSIVEYEDDELICNDEEFLNLYAVKSGDFTTQIGSKSDWVDKVKTSLFTGGIDPIVLKDDLQKKGADKKTLTHMRQFLRKQDEKARKESELQEIQNRRASILSSERKLNEGKQHLADLEKRIKHEEAEFRKYQEIVEHQEKIREKDKLFKVVKDIDDLNDKQSKQEKLEVYAEDRSSEALAIQDKVRMTNDVYARQDTTVDLLSKAVSEIERDLNDLKVEADTATKAIDKLEDLRDRISRDMPQPVMLTKVRWSTWGVITGIVMILLGISAGIVTGLSLFEAILTNIGLVSLAAPDGPVSVSLLGYMLMGATLVIGVLILFLTRKKDLVEDTTDRDAFVETVLKRWREIFGDEDVPSADSLRESVLKKKLGYEQLLGAFEDLQEKFSEKKDDLKKAEEVLNKAEGEREQAEKNHADWLKNMKVENLQQYGERIAEYQSLHKEIKGLEQVLQKSLADYQCDDLVALRSKAGILVEGLEERLSGIEKVSDSELARYKRELDERTQKIEQLRQKEKELALDINKEAGRISGSLGDLPEHIMNLKQDIVELAEDIRAIDQDRRAAAFAAEIFSAIADDSSFQFGQLSREIAAMFAQFLPGDEMIKITSLNEKDLRIKDGTGKYRSVDHLSSGTRDAFWLAARLVLARKARPEGPGIIVLDEPFHTLDDDRMQQAVKLLKAFRDKTNWQLVFFTKDKPVVEAVKSAFSSEVVFHAL